MSVIVCKVCQELEEQEVQFVAQVCPHLFENLKTEKIMSESQFQIIKVETELFGKSTVYHWFCNHCVKKYHLPIDGRILNKEEVDKKYKEAFDEL